MSVEEVGRRYNFIMHKNFFEFTSDNHYDLGYAMGSTFKKEAKRSLENNVNETWGQKTEMANDFLKMTKPHFPQYVAELEGYARGADVDFLDFWTLSLEDDVILNQQPAKCTSIVTNNGLLFGHNEDNTGPDLGDDVCLVKKKIGKLITFELYYYNTLGAAVGINSYGYCSSANTLFNEIKQIGIPRNFSSRYIFDSSAPDRVLAELSKLTRACGYSQNIVSKTGEVLNAEITSKEILTSDPLLPFVHTNHGLLGGKITTSDYHGTLSRLKFGRENANGKMSVGDMKELLSDSSLGKILSIDNERTVGKLIFEIEKKIVYIWLQREADLGWVEYPFEYLLT